MKLKRDFYKRDTIEVAKDLLGKILVRIDGNRVYRGKIVETEAYLGLEDRASHAYGGSITDRTRLLYAEGGFSYVFFIYGMYNCFNVTTRDKFTPEAVLIRALEPIDNFDEISINRYGMKYDEISNYKKKNITNGPGKLCVAFNITRDLNSEDLLGDKIYIEDINEIGEEINIVHSKRIGIDYAQEAKDFLYRFYIESNPYVSKKWLFIVPRDIFINRWFFWVRWYNIILFSMKK